MKEISLDYNSVAIKHLMKVDKRLARVISDVGPISYSVHTDGFVFLVHEVIEQMLSVKAANKIFNRLLEMCYNEITPRRILELSLEDIRSVGTSLSKAETIIRLATLCDSGQLNLNALKNYDDLQVTNELTSIKGIGAWTAKMYLIFVLDRQDILPTEDGVLLQSFKWLYKTDDCSKKVIEAKCKKWKPYSSIAARYLYRALDSGMTKREFHLYKREE